MKSTVTINAKLYGKLFNEGLERGLDSDSLIAVYCLCKAAKDGKDRLRPIVTKNNRKIVNFRLLHCVTKLSETTLKRYIPVLIELGVCNFSKDGSFYIKGNDKIAKEYKSSKTIKLEVGDGYKTLKLNSYFVRIKTQEKRQQKAIAKTDFKIKTLELFLEGQYLTPNRYEIAKKLFKEGVTLDKLKSHHNTVCLSNQGFYNLKKEIRNKKPNGQYWKAKLKSANKIFTKRRFTEVRVMSKEEFVSMKRHIDFMDRKRMSWSKGIMYEETIAQFSTEDIFTEDKPKVFKKKQHKPLEHLSFDFIAWCENS